MTRDPRNRRRATRRGRGYAGVVTATSLLMILVVGQPAAGGLPLPSLPLPLPSLPLPPLPPLPTLPPLPSLPLPPLPTLPPLPSLPLPPLPTVPPLPSLPVPTVPPLPSLPLPTVPPLPSLPLPTAMPGPNASSTPAPTGPPTATPTSSSGPGSSDPGGTSGTFVGGSLSSSPPGGAAFLSPGPAKPADQGRSPLEFLVPGIIGGVSIFLVLLIVLLQFAGGAAWLPLARRWLQHHPITGLGRRPPQ
jgi:hypothetical protein